MFYVYQYRTLDSSKWCSTITRSHGLVIWTRFLVDVVVDGVHREITVVGYVVHHQCSGQLRLNCGVTYRYHRLSRQPRFICLQIPGISHRIRVHDSMANDAQIFGI